VASTDGLPIECLRNIRSVSDFGFSKGARVMKESEHRTGGTLTDSGEAADGVGGTGTGIGTGTTEASRESLNGS
jgi:hypothetical protein